jgi:type IV secretory pathway VirB6-like protein
LRHCANPKQGGDRLYSTYKQISALWVLEDMLDRQAASKIYGKVCNIIADNLHISRDSVYAGFQVNRFIENLASYRIQKSGNPHLLYYLEAVNIYFDLSEEFKIEFPINLMEKNSMTVKDLVEYIQENCVAKT